MDALDLIEHINYNGGKQVDYAYNKTGDLVKMDDWSGTTTYEVDLLHQLTATTDRLGRHVAYTYDGVGNQTSVSYPDGTTATKEYDLVHNLTTVIEEDGHTTSYTYDGMRRVTHMDYPDGWQEDYHYDSIGQLLAIEDTDPTQKDMKQQKNTFEYDVCGNMIHEYMRGNGTGETTTDVTYTYDELHRVTSAHELYGNTWRQYQYDSLSNLTYESNSNNVHYDYKLNNLNQLVQKFYSSNNKEGTLYTYDKRGNLILEEYGKLNGNPNGQKRQTVAEYTYDETNKMVKGVNSIGESSSYLFNGRNALVEQTWHIAKNGYGYHDVDAGIEDPADTTNGKGGNGSGGKGHGNGNGQGNGNGSGDKPTGTTVGSFSTVVKQFVIDYTAETMDPLMEHEVNGLDYRYVYGNERLSVNISPIPNGAGHIVESGTVGQQIRLYYHQDLRGTVDYLTSPVSQKVESWTHYNEWGEITHNAVLKTGYRELDLVKNYTGHDFDAVLNMYYAKARMYDAENRRFVALDPIMDGSKYDISERITDPTMFVQYLYVKNMPLIATDPLGLMLDRQAGDSNSSKRTVVYTVTENNVNMRVSAGLHGTVIRQVNKGDTLTALGQETFNDGYYWAKVQYSGVSGWVAKAYLQPETSMPGASNHSNQQLLLNELKQQASSKESGNTTKENSIAKTDTIVIESYGSSKDELSDDTWFDQFVAPIANIFNTYTLYRNDVERQKSLAVGILAGTIQDLGEQAAVVLDAFSNLPVVANWNLEPQTLLSNYAHNGSTEMDRQLTSKVTYADSYYLGKVIADAAIVVVETGAGAYAAAKTIAGGAETLGGLGAILSGIGAPEGVVAMAQGVGVAVAGAAEFGAATAIASVAADNFGQNWDKYKEYQKKLACEGTGADNPLVDTWGDGNRGSPYSNAKHHYDKHGTEVGAKDFDDYLRKANAFKETVLSKKSIKPYSIPGASPDVYRYVYNGKYIDLQYIYGTDLLGAPKVIDYKIISYGLR